MLLNISHTWTFVDHICMQLNFKIQIILVELLLSSYELILQNDFLFAFSICRNTNTISFLIFINNLKSI
jgi:hypothetical protein